jgi:hypothetical protein
MIIKYLNDGWNYIDHVTHVKNNSIIIEELIRQFDEDVKNGKRDALETIGVKSDIAVKAYLQIVKYLNEDCGYHNVNIEDLLSEQMIDTIPATLVYIFSDNSDNVTVLLTNQIVYLMNDKGQTIERLV